MKTASRVLGIIGGALSIIIALFCLLIVLNVNADWEYHFGDSTPMSVSYCSDSVDPNANDTELTALLVILVLPGILCGGMGIFGGIIVPKRSTAAGVMFIISAVLGLLFFITTICFILAAIFAFIKEKPRMPYYPYYPYYPYPPASPYGYTPYGTPYQPPYGTPYYPAPPYGQPPQPYPPQPYPSQTQTPPAPQSGDTTTSQGDDSAKPPQA